MTKLILLLTILGNIQDPWWGKDKVRHLGTAYILTKMAMQHGVRKEFSAGLVITLSIGKEFYDKRVKKTFFSFKDLFYDAIGVGLGLIL